MTNTTIQASLNQILSNADIDDLDVLVDYITDSGNGRISLDKAICSRLLNAKTQRIYKSDERILIERELRQFGGNTVANLVREARGFLGGLSPLRALGSPTDAMPEVQYDEIVRDVAEHLKVKFDKYVGTPQVEDGILKSLLVASFEKMTPEERSTVLKDLEIPDAADLANRSVAAIGFGIAAASLNTAVAYHLSQSVASAAVRALLGRGLTTGATSIVARPMAALVGPIGWAVTGAWALADMASPAYRVTVPCVVQVAYMRKKTQMQNSQSEGNAQQA